MKRLFYLAASLIAVGAMAVSCNFGRLDLDDTTWEVYKVEERFNGSVITSTHTAGRVDIFAEGGYRYYALTLDEFSIPGWEYDEEDVTVVRQSGKELVLDFFHYEYDDVYKDECDYYETYYGVRIYKAYYVDSYSGKLEHYYVYFRPNGLAVDVGGCWQGYEEDWCDTWRLYCRLR